MTWQNEIVEKQSAIYLQMGVVLAHYVEKRELSCFIHIKHKQIKPLRFVSSAD
ncbi:MAG TPA: hypothetical protein VEV44_02735 [Pseudoneobacillus sp.]|nr:hypothetical protein [Pseudoneobacillus sp.]